LDKRVAQMHCDWLAINLLKVTQTVLELKASIGVVDKQILADKIEASVVETKALALTLRKLQTASQPGAARQGPTTPRRLSLADWPIRGSKSGRSVSQAVGRS
jgi:hypothetical protein